MQGPSDSFTSAEQTQTTTEPKDLTKLIQPKNRRTHCLNIGASGIENVVLLCRTSVEGGGDLLGPAAQQFGDKLRAAPIRAMPVNYTGRTSMEIGIHERPRRVAANFNIPAVVSTCFAS